uniref:Ig-like domain-containing protein n=1 Tax=Scleropages formosus TaxID=113540 RepID=A0A8C9SEB4_SCLFO
MNVFPTSVYEETPPKLQIPMETPSEDIYTGERLTLTCTVDGDSTGWKYLWYKDTQRTELSNIENDRTDGSSYTISSAAPSHSGQYWCRAHRGGFYSHYINIQGEDLMNNLPTKGVPQPVLSLHCDVQGSSTRWVYKWYRDGQEIPISGDGDTYTILSAARSHSGQYQCRGELPERAVTSPHSHSLNLTVYGTVLLSYFVFMLRCSAMFLLYSTGWKYLWYKDTQGAVLSNTDSDRTDGSSYTISSAAPSHSGQYWCRAHRGEFYSHYSDSHKVNIQDGIQIPLEHNGETFSVTSGNGSYHRECRCRGNRTEKPFYSHMSNGVVLNNISKRMFYYYFFFLNVFSSFFCLLTSILT